jgi:SpoVK/Ycf46/Vps4 family AAA+-type ATPase
MLRSHLSDAALTTAKAWSHDEVEPRHVGYAIVQHFRGNPDFDRMAAPAKSALHPRGTSFAVPEFTEAARALLGSIESEEDALAALVDLLGRDRSGAPGHPEPRAAEAVQDVGDADLDKASEPQAIEPPPSESVSDILAELDALVGLRSVKEQVRSVVAVVQANQARADAGLATVNPGLHLVFTGPPGTGKTTVARLIARLYAACGALPKATFAEVDRSDLVAGFVGQTAIKTADVMRKTRPGVLFVDEAYSLTPSHPSDFGAEAIATLVKAMEDHRDDLAVIVAGYRDEMTHFVESNPGLRSRLKTYIDFPDFQPTELAEIFSILVESAGLRLAPGAAEAAERIFADAVGRPAFGNARFARSLFEQAYARMAVRAAADGIVEVEELMELLAEDLESSDSGPTSKQRPIGFGGSS